MEIEVPERNPLRNLSFPPVSKPLTHREYNRSQAETGGSNADNKVRLILIQTGANLGFAGGNNVGLKYISAKNDCEYIWLLNNDTVVRPDALSYLVQRMKERPDAGICGSTLPYYHQPNKIWAFGGATYNKWIAKPRCIGLNEPFSPDIDVLHIEDHLDFIAGASMLVSQSFLRDIGLMSEDYFLYFEEQDWAVRARGRYALVNASKSIVYHKVGASTSLHGSQGNTSMADYFMFRNSILFTYKYYPYALPFVLTRVSIIYIVKMILSACRKFSAIGRSRTWKY
jgi:GT2 family glycosyltransferase